MSIVNKNKLEISPRNPTFPFDELVNPFFYNNNRIISTYIAAMSATFPGGEKGFIDSVRYYRDQVKDPELLNQIKGFIGQEGHHSHQHKKVYRKLDELGLTVSKLEKDLEKRIEKNKAQLDPKNFLAVTVGMEHLTAIMAEYVLENPDILSPLPASAKDLLLWHAVEEIEHKSVAFDVYQECVGERRRLHIMMIYGTFLGLWRVSLFQASLLLSTKKLPRISDAIEASKILLGKKGFLRGIARPYLDFFNNDFEPWDHQNSHLVDQWKAQNLPTRNS